MSKKVPLDKLYAIRYRAKAYSAKRLLNPEAERAFLNFLIRALGENVFLISTRLGLDIYYLGKVNCSRFITANFWLFQTVKDSDKNRFYIIENQGAQVLDFFDNAVDSLSRHPQLFLSCCKKLILKFNESGTRTLLNQRLYTCFDRQLNRLTTEDRIPFAEKVKQLRKRYEQPFLNTDNITKQLLKEFSLRNAVN